MMKCDMCYDRTSRRASGRCAPPSARPRRWRTRTLEEIERTRRGHADQRVALRRRGGAHEGLRDGAAATRESRDLVQSRDTSSIAALRRARTPATAGAAARCMRRRGGVARRGDIEARRERPPSPLARGLPDPLGERPLRHPPRARQVPDPRLGPARRRQRGDRPLLGRRRAPASGAHAAGARRRAASPAASLLFRYPTDEDPCILVRARRRRVRAYSQVCTHLSCAVVHHQQDPRSCIVPATTATSDCADGRVSPARPRGGCRASCWSRAATSIFAVGMEV